MNNLYRKIGIPFEVNTPDFPISEGTFVHPAKVTMYDYVTESLDSRFLDLLHQLGISIFRSEIFYIPPHDVVPIHVDTSRFSNMVKINFHVGASTCCINWYDPLPEFMNKSPLKTPLDTEYLVYEPHEVQLIESQHVHSVSFMNAGVPHGYVNNSNLPSWILSIALLQGNSNLQFKEALEIFKNYIEE